MIKANDYFTFNPSESTTSSIDTYIRTICDSSNNDILSCILSFVDFDDLLNIKRTSKLFHNSISKKIIKKYAQIGCITDRTRKLYYMNMIDINKTKNLILKELTDYKITDKFYENILRLAEEEKTKKDHPFMKVCEEIGRDITRTFYTDKFVNGNGKEMIDNILTAIAFIRPEIGYCQGMNFIAGALVSYIDEEKINFYIFLTFIDDIELNLLYLKNMPDYSIRVYQLNYFIKKFFPKLNIHFKKNQINPDIFFSKWILAIFSSYLPFEVLCKVWDVFIIDKWKAIFKFSMAFLAIMEDELLTMDLQTFSQYFRSNATNSHLEYKKISKFYDKFKITNKELDELREDFFVDQVKEKLDDPEGKWDTDQNEYVNVYKTELEKLLKENSKRTVVLKEKIETMNKECQHAQTSYENQLKNCGNLKLKVEVLIEMKAGYENVLKNMGNKEEGTKEKKKKLFSINSIKHIHEPKTEYEKIQKKLKHANKEIDQLNKMMLDNYKLLDKKKYSLEKMNKEKEAVKNELENIMNDSEKAKKELIKNLSQKLKLSAKFVATSKY